MAAAGFALLIPLLFITALPIDGWSARYVILPIEAAVGLPLLLLMIRTRLRWVGVAILGWLVWGLFSMALSPNPSLAFWGAFDVGTGVLYMLAVGGLWALGAMAGDRGTVVVERALIAGGAVNAIFALVSAARGASGAGVTQTGLWGNAAILAAFLLGVLWLLAPHLRSARIPVATLIVVVAAGIQVAGERFVLLLLLPLAVGALCRLGRKTGSIFAVLVLAGLLLGVGIGQLSATPTAVSRAANPDSEGVRPRLEVWAAAAHAVEHRPILGEGPGRFAAATDPLRTLALVRSRGADVYFADAHDLLVEYAVTTGLPGLLLFVAFVGLALWAGRRRPSLTGFACAVLAVQLVQPQSVGLTPLAFLALGAAAAPAVRPRIGALAAIAEALALAVGAGVAAALFVGLFAYQRMEIGHRLADGATARLLLPTWPTVSVEYGRAVFLRDVERAARPQTSFADWAAWDRVAIGDDPQDPTSYIQAGQAEYLAGQLGLAASTLTHALRLDPWSVDAANSLGNVAIAEHHPDAAIGWFERSLRADPSQPDIRRQLDLIVGRPAPAPSPTDNTITVSS